MIPMNLQAFPVAHGMIELSRRSNLDDFIRYMCLWSAFNNIYQYLGDGDGLSATLHRVNPYPGSREIDGYFLPHVRTQSEQKLILNAVQKLTDTQKSDLLLKPQVEFFVRRTPKGAAGDILPGRRGLFDPRGQRINGVLNRTRTVDPLYPYYAPIDLEKFEALQAGDLSHLQLLSEQLAMLLYTVRNNLMHGHKEVRSDNDGEVVRNAYPILEYLVNCFVIIPEARG